MKPVFLCIPSLLFLSLYGQDLNEYKKELFTNDGQSLPYRILYPLAFDTNKSIRC